MFKQLEDPEEYNPTNLDKINSRKETLINAEELNNNRYNVNKTFEDRIFPLKDGFYQKEESDVTGKALQDQVKVNKKDVYQIKNKVLKAKKNNKQARPTGYGKTVSFVTKHLN